MIGGELIGRDRELDDVAARFDSHRLVTLVGPGGVGKTALAAAVAERVGPQFPRGVHVVDLTRVDREEAVPGAIAGQLGFESFEALLDSPSDQPALLLLDNCEHLLDVVAECTVQVLGACRQPSVLATSRSPLELPGESVGAIAPLAVPRGGVDPMSCPSVHLFLARLRDAGVGAEAAEIEVVADLARQLDGLPLAIEIAAARARSMSLSDISRGLQEGTGALERPRFRGDPRHRSIADAIAWSYALLSPEAAHVLDHVAVFAGPFTVPSAAAIAGMGDTATAAAFDELVGSSLVALDAGAGGTSYRLLATVRRFAADRLRSTPAGQAAFDRFADHTLATLRALVADAGTSWRPGLIRDLLGVFDDVAEALRWCVANDASPRRAYALCGSLWGIVHQGRAGEVAVLARAVLDRWPDPDSQAGALAVATLATAEYTTGHPERALELAVPAFERLTSPGPAAVTLRRVIGQGRRALGDLPGAEEMFRSGAEMGHELGLGAMALELETAAAIVRADRGDPAGAATELRELVGHAEAIRSPLSVCWLHTALGWVLLRAEPVTARAAIDRALADSRANDYPIGITAGLRSRAYGELLAGDLAAAIGTARELADELVARGAMSNARLLYDVAAVLAHQAGHDGWPLLAAARRAAPITTLVCAHHELVPLPADAVPASAPAPRDALRQARQVLDELMSGARPGAMPSTQQVDRTALVRRLGGVVEWTFAGRTVSVRASKGVLDVVALIAAGGRELHCADLAGVSVEQMSTGEVIDTAGRRRYEARIRELQAEIDEAEANNDHVRAYRHQAELDAIVDHLSAALGRGSRTRRSAGSAERARSAVTHRVRSAVRQLTTVHPPLGHHLSHAVSTGTYCAYRPEHPVVWDVH